MDARDAETVTSDSTGVCDREVACVVCAGIVAAGTGAAADWVSRVEGSAGGGPSIAHRLDSYLERMNESIL